MRTNPKPNNKKSNIVMLMTDDTGWSDFSCYEEHKSERLNGRSVRQRLIDQGLILRIPNQKVVLIVPPMECYESAAMKWTLETGGRGLWIKSEG